MVSFQILQPRWVGKRPSYSWSLIVLNLLFFLSIISANNSLKNDEVSMGTTILAVRYKGGVVVGADTRTSVSGYVSNRYAAKLTFVLDREVDEFVTYANSPTQIDASTCVICRSGSAADTQHLASVIRTELVSRQLLYRIRGTVTHVASLLRNLLANEPSLSASLICAGYDSELGRGVIYTITPGGTVFEEKLWAAGGSGSTYILGHLDSCHPKDELGKDSNDQILNSEEEALDFVSKAISLAMDRDGSSGGFIRMYVINKGGKRFVSKFVDRSSQRNNIDVDIASQLSLRHFAPAVTKKSSPSKPIN
jgi:20S proteasome subunit beta 1